MRPDQCGFGRLASLPPAERAVVEQFAAFLIDMRSLERGELHPGTFEQRWGAYWRGEPDAATEAGPALGRGADAAT